MNTSKLPALVLHYIFDPLCGWCYAAAPLVKAAREVPGIDVQWHAGGMLTGAHTRTITADWRDKVMPSDQRIAEMTGQPFGDAYLNGLLNDIGAPLDSEPPTTALLAAEALAGKGLEMLAAEQKAHYVEGRRISEPAVLRELAAGIGLDSAAYDAAYAEQSGAATQKHIAESREWLGMVQGQGFPTLALEFDHPEQAGQRAVQRIEIGEWLGDADGWKQQLAAWAEQIAELNQQPAGDTDTSGDPSCGPDGCELPPR
ncbi:DsbA family protein [Comamonas thiooxydans]|uniref:Protein-disulfide isomerase n=1 Tax=Comamonas thiooxydans TaxID=363952 RepID=A0A0E3C5B3_9BURK|nr:DsbA family protein [Comamonas thiooxydans]KGH19391.1 protein-disulfide isomerase [Comamonas thiooxydans]KGH27367.1 protein-disulfide isomerase [Comamonas thiooxydans]KGH27591.1 protein-disulfide isomerase [Comamonas thiooxydans]